MKVLIFILIILSLITITLSVTINGKKRIIISDKMAAGIGKLCGFIAAILYAIFIL